MATKRAEAWRLVRRVVAFEVQMWWSLYRWMFRRPPTRDRAAAAFGYSKATTPIVWTFIVLNAIEIPAIHLILPWEHVRGIVDIAGLYGLIWMFGLLASRTVNPHILDGRGMQVRNGGTQKFAVAWDAVAAVRVRKRTYPKSRAVQVEDTPGGAVLSVTVLSQTNVDVVLRQPTVLRLPDGSDLTIAELRCYADDAASLVAQAGSHLEARVSGEK
jgi:hypothetical protein